MAAERPKKGWVVRTAICAAGSSEAMARCTRHWTWRTGGAWLASAVQLGTRTGSDGGASAGLRRNWGGEVLSLHVNGGI